MKRKFKFLTSVALLSMSVAGLIMGVYSLVQRQVSIGGTVSFSASTVRADYLVERTDAYTGEVLPAFTTVGSGSFNVDMQDNATEQLGNIMLSDNAEKFAYRVTITSTETTRDLIVEHTVPAPTEDWLTVFVNDSTTPETTHTITQGQNMVFTFVIEADGTTAPETAENIEIGANFTISLTDQDEEIETIARHQRRLLKQQNEENNKINQIQNVTDQKQQPSITNQTNTTRNITNNENVNQTANTVKNMGSDTMGTITNRQQNNNQTTQNLQRRQTQNQNN